MSLKEKIFGSGFDLEGVKPAILAMAKLQSHETLILNRAGLFGTTNRKRVWQRKPQPLTIRIVFSSFCHPIKNPLSRPNLKKVVCKTLFFSKRALNNLPIQGEEKEVLELIIRSYERISFLQERLLGLAEKVIKRKPSPLILDAQQALKAGKKPVRPAHGCSGAYYVPGISRSFAAVFKPFDEEIGAPNNPKKARFRGALAERAGGFYTAVGEGMFKEMAAYLIDRHLKLHIVPYTTCTAFESSFFYDNQGGHLLKKTKRKIGSFQEYKAGFYHIYEINQKSIEGIPLDQLQRLVLLDLIIGNQDRNGGNLLTNGREIVAIDHGYSLSHALVRRPLLQSFKKLPQMGEALLPLLVHKLGQINILKLRGKLKKQTHLDERSLDRLEERVVLIQTAVEEGLKLSQLIDLMQPKILARLVGRKKTLALRAKGLIRSIFS